MSDELKVSSDSWQKEVMETQDYVLVDFWAPWCGPCRMVAPVLEELAKEYAGKLKILKLNTDENPDVASRYNIMGIPAMLFFKGGKVIDQVVGALPKNQLKAKIDSIIA